MVVVAVVYGGHNRTSSNTSTGKTLLSTSTANQKTSAPLDIVSSADIAANIANVASIPEVLSVANTADSFNAQLTQATTEQAVVSKPQIVAGASKSIKDLVNYTAQEGDTLSSLAQKFGVTSDTIRWSNGITSENIPAGKKLIIAPMNGIVYKVQTGDTVDSLATKYQSNKEKITIFNDIEISGLTVGNYILLPDGQQPVQPRATTSYASSNSSVAVYGFVARYGGNGYAYGYCTYYAAAKAGVPSNWGNANTWDNYARASGWTVSSRPIVGAVFQTDAGYAGHVGIVVEVSPDGSQIRISDMNGVAGFNRVGYSGWIPVSTYPNYIYR
jgi:surface antigen/biotin carboxyl carrier protein